ncbi:MAG TPA: hypothetical protein VHV83_19455 [Armatimonadota bacterium]|nr:hypothetical protein [Armatimonadota bacterium]
MIRLQSIPLLFVLVVVSLLLLGCGGSGDVGSVQPNRDTAQTNAFGEAYLYYSSDHQETISVRNSSTNQPIADIQVLGMIDYSENQLFVAADPHQHYLPTITSGKDMGNDPTRIYLPQADQYTGTNATSYTEVNGGLLYDMAQTYQKAQVDTTVADLRDKLALLAYGKSAGLVVCVSKILNSYAGQMAATQITQQSNDMTAAFQAIGWQYIYTSRGFTPDQHLNIWVIDPKKLAICPGSIGALADTFIAIVAPLTDPAGTISTGKLKVELCWSAPVDLDLHLIRNGAALYDLYNDCYWRNMELNWGPEISEHPRLLGDCTDGIYSPETTRLDEMNANDTYEVYVDYWGDPHGNPIDRAVTATVKVWIQGNPQPKIFPVSGLVHGIPGTGDGQTVCTISGATGDVFTNMVSRTQTTVRSRALSPGVKSR